MVLVEVGLDVECILSAPWLRQESVVVREEAMSDTCKLLPSRKMPGGAVVHVELNHSTRDFVTWHIFLAEMCVYTGVEV